MRRHLKVASIAAGLAILTAGIFLLWQRSQEPAERYPLAVMTSLPIYWPEGSDIAALVNSNSELPWVRETLERRYQITPLDSLAPTSEGAAGPLQEFNRLLLAQPRGLSPSDNAALDEWVRGGGRLLYMLDPMLTGHYSVPVGDPSHPTLVGLVPPVVLRWGLTLQFSDQQSFELREASYGAGQLPVQLAGEVLLLTETESFTQAQLDARGSCEILGDGLAASCQVGQGRALLVADAALLEMHEPEGAAEEQLLALVEQALEQ